MIGIPSVHESVRAGDVKRVRAFLRKHPDRVDDETALSYARERPYHVVSLLHEAAAWGHADIAEALLAAGAQIDRLDSGGRSALLLASACGHAPVVELLLARGADTEVKAFLGTALHLAARRLCEGDDRDDALFPLPVGTRVRVVASPPEPSPAQDFRRVVDLLLARGADPNIADGLGETPLMIAARAGDVDLAQRLLQGNARLDAGDTPPIIIAARQDDVPMTGLLLDHGADLAVQDEAGRTALEAAAGSGSQGTVQLLASRGARVSPASLMAAIRTDDGDLVDLLLSRGADPNGAGGEETPLHAAASAGAVQSVERLLRAGAPVDPRSRLQRTPLHCAVMGNHPEAVERLLDAGANIDAADGGGETPLHFAVLADNAGMAALLVQRGADSHVKRPATAFGAAPEDATELAARSEQRALRELFGPMVTR